MVVVEAVGASPREHASLAMEQSSATSAASARVESFTGPDVLFPGRTRSILQIGSAVMLIRGTCSRLMVARRRRISSGLTAGREREHNVSRAPPCRGRRESHPPDA